SGASTGNECPPVPQRTARGERVEPSGNPVGGRSQLPTLSALPRRRWTLHRLQQKYRRKRPREPAPSPFCGSPTRRAGTPTKRVAAQRKGELSRLACRVIGQRSPYPPLRSPIRPVLGRGVASPGGPAEQLRLLGDPRTRVVADLGADQTLELGVVLADEIVMRGVRCEVDRLGRIGGPVVE